ncbi:TPA: hypothetical protein ACJIOU_005099, partial [Escherichia coli]
MNDQQIQLALHITQLISDRLFFLRMDSHPHAICGAGFLMALLHGGKEFATNAEVVAALAEVYETLPQVLGDLRGDAPGCTGHDFTPLKQDQFDTMTLQLLDLLRGLRYVPETNSF